MQESKQGAPPVVVLGRNGEISAKCTESPYKGSYITVDKLKVNTVLFFALICS